MKRIINTFLVIILPTLSIFSQTTPGNIGTTNGDSELVLWLKSSELANSLKLGQPCLLWKDLSGYEHNLYSTENDAPVWDNDLLSNFPAVHFEGNEYLQMENTSSAFSPTESTIFTVTSGLHEGTTISISEKFWLNEMLFFEKGVYHHSSSGNFTRSSIACVEDRLPHQISVSCGVFGRTTQDVRYIFNGIVSTNPLETAGSPWNFDEVDRKVTLGQRDQFVNSEFYQGYIYEVIVYNRKLNPQEILAVQEYLQCSYNLENEQCTNFGEVDCTTVTIPSFNCNYILRAGPVPTVDWLYIHLENSTIESEAIPYQIYNVIGQKMQEGVLPSQEQALQVNQLKSGIYLLVLQQCDQEIVQKFIVDK